MARSVACNRDRNQSAYVRENGASSRAAICRGIGASDKKDGPAQRDIANLLTAGELKLEGTKVGVA